ncbi:MAG: type II toxin-antitoxin system HicA family toxin [Candidatus Lokiarchaeota archaeon]|nr:type II toxin-antitoxin system HicA family toxin [Candidatus Lokiarchaeota archaeon]
MPKLPVVSGEQVKKLLLKLGYTIVRQKDSHIQLKKAKDDQEHAITVPNHDELAVGTLNDILTRVAEWNGISKEKLIKML